MPNSFADFPLGADGFTYADLYRPARLRDLAEVFYAELNSRDAELHGKLRAYIAAEGEGYTQKDESDILVNAAPYLSEFTARLFGVAAERRQLIESIKVQDPLWTFKTFLTRRAIKTFPAEAAAGLDAEMLDAWFDRFCQEFFPHAIHSDRELRVAYVVSQLLAVEALEKPQGEPDHKSRALLDKLRAAQDHFDNATNRTGLALSLVSVSEEFSQVKAALRLMEAWAAAHHFQPAAKERVKDWVTFKTPRPFDHQNLVHIERPRPDLPEEMQAPAHEWHRRDGFGLTDKRGTPRQRLYEADYCLHCHERAKDSCSKGFHEKDGAVKRNPLNVKLAGCPLDEKISEMHVLKKQGDSLAALAVVLIDNPMCPGTGHRVCNDCMTACIFQKQEPVNIPFSETGILTDVLELPYGYEIYSLLTRWNPLNAKQPYAKEYNGKNVLVVGLGPAGYTLAHYLLNEGFGVIGVDGLKIEPLPEELFAQPVKDFEAFCTNLDERILRGFGGVSEYGITVRWDKNFLKAIYLTLARREYFRAFGGVRFGGALDADDAWALGFDHIALATGAGKPTIVQMKNNLLRGIRKATDFLMALQLGGAFRRDLLVNLQMRLPALVIGGGLTAFDNGTEAFAYYPVQVEKHLERHEQLDETTVYAQLNREEREIYDEFLTHGRAIRAERQRAAAAGEEPDFAPLVRAWGGVQLVYRKRLQDCPAYRLNHEEVELALREGFSFIEKMSPVEAVPDEYGAVKEMIFERQARNEEGKWRGTGELVTLPARTVCVAAGTSPNNTYERERPGTFRLDERQQFMQPHTATRNGDGAFHLVPAQKDERGLFTSYEKDGRFITFYGDDHPAYAGNVVKAMASAKHSYKAIAALFADETALSAGQQSRFRELVRKLESQWLPRVESVERLTPKTVALTIYAPAAARHFRPGHFFKVQNYETNAQQINGAKLLMEGIPLAGVGADTENDTVRLVVEETGASSRIAAGLQPGQRVMLMGPNGAAAEIPEKEKVMLIGQGFGNAVLLPLARAMQENSCLVLWFAAYKDGADSYFREEIEAACGQVVWITGGGAEIPFRRPHDKHWRGKTEDALLAYATGDLGVIALDLAKVSRIIVSGGPDLLATVRQARQGPLAAYLNPQHSCAGTLYSPMQCMMKEVCATCLHRQIDPQTGQETFVYSCVDTHQRLDFVDLDNFNGRLTANSVAEKQTNIWLESVLMGHGGAAF
jgi:NADPH-dependent glutamate synthase beta subunit-like oxidoreductase/NAD(P)H-flavin reductase